MPRRKIDWYGPRLRELREQAGLSQAELGQRVNVAGSQINKLETNVNQPTLATALAIAEALDCAITDFVRAESSTSRPGAKRAMPSTPPAEDLEREEKIQHGKKSSARPRKEK